MSATPLTLVHRRAVDPAAVVALFERPGFSFRTWMGHLLPEPRVVELVDDTVVVLVVGTVPVGLVGVSQAAEDHAGHHRLALDLREPRDVASYSRAVGLAVDHARALHDVVRLTAIVPQDDGIAATAYARHGFVDEGVLPGVVVRGGRRTGVRQLALVTPPTEEDL